MLPFDESFLQIFEKFARDAEQAGCRFELDISGDVRRKNPEFILDVERIEQVMYNLVNNAMKNMPKPGKITVGCELSEEKFLVIRISDTGSGIEKKDLPHIFEMFYTVSNDAKSKGTGLGLAISKEILAKHGAGISAESELNQGTTFTIKFPCAASTL